MENQRSKTCCFSGYRIEKMPFRADNSHAVHLLEQRSTMRCASRAGRLQPVYHRHVHRL